MADKTHLDKLQADATLRQARNVKLAAARSFLAYLSDAEAPLTYGDILRRLQALIATELQHEEG